MSRRLKMLLAGTMAVVLVGVGVAVAAWLISGSGNGTAKAGSLTTLTVTAGTASGDLYPGASGDLFLKVTNPNNLPLKIVSVAPNGAITSDQGSSCGAADVAFATVSGLSIPLAANEIDVPVTLDGAVHMVADAANACQGATFTIPVTVNAQTP